MANGPSSPHGNEETMSHSSWLPQNHATFVGLQNFPINRLHNDAPVTIDAFIRFLLSFLEQESHCPRSLKMPFKELVDWLDKRGCPLNSQTPPSSQ
jgi:hypothetical protein